ncbi:hypothetical protein HU200_003361 [Digitaria exilis]|uniref:Protein kinase domain-containing protein n=1 Tax=Digitaria exilis TaxID=1010633 RepID=A0A835FXY8_9POAL|nr:hypothetical protein HU200_003361 [Digitaria exilis]
MHAAMAALLIHLLLLLCFFFAELAHGQQVDTLGFISIDCGISDSLAPYADQSTRGLRYVSDAGFTDAGLNAGVNPPYNIKGLADRYLTARFFPSSGDNSRRSCYTLRPVIAGGRYLVRATFYYGNYDDLNKLPTFDLHLGVNRWVTVNVTAAGEVYIFEAVVVSPEEFFQVCLVNRGLGTPFISGLDLRPLQDDMYTDATVNQSLALLNYRRPAATYSFNRFHFWRPASTYRVFRYPFDPYDRLWESYGDIDAWTNITSSTAVDISNISSFHRPSKILWSAATPLNGTRMDFTWGVDDSINNDNTSYLLMLYFAEVQRLPSNALRQFDILVDNATWNGSQGYSPKYLSAELVKRMVPGSSQHTVSLVATTDATLPPILNALEIYSVLPMTELATNGADAKAMMTIRTKYALKKNWMGDPCAPKVFAWDGLNCSYSSSGPAWITALDLSSNKLSGPVPAVLLQKQQNGSLVLRIGNNAKLCDNGASTCDPENKIDKRILVIAIVVPISVATLLFVAAFLILRRMTNKQGLEYLHKACQPLLIHRDVKTTNILLSAELVAKISDFGLTKVFADDFMSHITTQPAGTLGYLDPEYYNTSRLSEKSDVYSFGVVLLELITGQPPVVPVTETQSIHIAHWVRQKLSMGNIESIVDPRMGAEYDVNSVWKVAELALQCKERLSQERPTMTDIIVELKESMELDVLHAMGYYSSAPSSTINLSAASVDLQSDAQEGDARKETMLELEQLGNRSSTQLGPAPR